MDIHKITLSESDFRGLVAGHILTLGEHGEIQICLKDIGFARMIKIMRETDLNQRTRLLSLEERKRLGIDQFPR